jgi:hypothetical protein
MIAIGVLFIIQLVIIFCIVLLNSKISKFKQLEEKQDRLVREMDDALSAYILEIREENDRLVEQLKETTILKQQAQSFNNDALVLAKNIEEDVKYKADPIEPKEEALYIPPLNIVTKSKASALYKQHLQVEEPSSVQTAIAQPILKEEPIVLTFEQQVIADYKAGMTVEQIAKKSNRGKTEIELLIKFHA